MKRNSKMEGEKKELGIHQGRRSLLAGTSLKSEIKQEGRGTIVKLSPDN